MRYFLIGLLLFFGFAGTVMAEEGPPNKTVLPSTEERQRRLKDIDLSLPEQPPEEIQDQKTAEKYFEALKKYYDYRIAGYHHRLRLFEWQFLSSRIIFFVVILLVFSGIYFAAVQFHAGLKQSKKDGEDSTEFVLTLKGFKVKSPVLGVIVLTVSLAFFYLYLVYVFPIENVF